METTMLVNEFNKQIKQELLAKVKSCMIKPCLAIIQVGTDLTSTKYIEILEKLANEIGLHIRHFKYDENVSEREVVNKIVELNNDEYISGIMVQFPISNRLNSKRIVNIIDVSKDVNSLTDKSMARLCNNRKGFIPSTSLAVKELIAMNNLKLSGKNVVIVGRSNRVGKPLFNMLLNNDATVTMCHSNTVNLKEITKTADVLISATGNKDLIRADMVKENAVVIDLGMTYENENFYGDVEKEVEKISQLYINISNGLMTLIVYMLFKNVIESYNNRITS